MAVFATQQSQTTLRLTDGNTANTGSSLLITTQTTDNTQNQANTANSTINSTTNNTAMPNTGVEELPWMIIVICVVSAVFAYNKIKEYKEY